MFCFMHIEFKHPIHQGSDGQILKVFNSLNNLNIMNNDNNLDNNLASHWLSFEDKGQLGVCLVKNKFLIFFN